MTKLFPDKEMIQPEIRDAWKALKHAGFDIDTAEWLCIADLKRTKQEEFIPFLREQFNILRRVYGIDN